MKAEDRVRAAYRALAERAARQADVEAGLRRAMRARRVAPAAAAVAVVVGLIGGAAWLGLFPAAPEPASTPATTPAPQTSSTTSSIPPATNPPPAVPDRYRVATDGLPDGALPLRTAPDPTAPVIAELPPAYAGIRRLGETQTLDDGSVWYRVRLIEPVTVVADGDEPIVGWLDSTYLVPLPEGLAVTNAELEPCEGGTDFEATNPTSVFVSSLRMAAVAEGCTRIVVGFSSGDAPSGWSDIGDGTAPAASPPSWRILQAPWPLIIHFPDLTSAWGDAAGEAGAYLVRQPDRSLALVVTRPADEVWVRTIGGRLVVDLREASRPQPPWGPAAALLRAPFTGPGRVEATGLARPFEANLAVWVESEDGTVQEAVFSGSPTLGTRRTDRYAIPTNDWVEAWAPFAVRVEDLAPGEYRLVFDTGGQEPLSVPFTVQRSGPAPEVPSDEANELARRLVDFATGGTPPPMADEVTLRLADQVSISRPATAMTDPSNWVVDDALFAGRVGPFDLLDGLRRWPNITVSERRTSPRCGGRPADWWPTETLLQLPVVIEPVGVESCLEWYSLSVLVDGNGAVAELVLDLYEP